ncbi:MAG: pyridoxal phosphate-dependent aminotransferase family protein [Epsilonproteobacteria bacterium]|nr:pyridoxal phosphate-dependent aminotransferase family protein [Campylobacterota bacterium]
MDYYNKELQALKRAGRFRSRELSDAACKDFASNDYLGLAHNKQLHSVTCNILSQQELHASKASLLVNGYHQIHKDFEDALCEANGFEAGVVVGSGFNANIALIESLVRKGDRLFMDELYHASGVLATNLEHVDVTFFKHNDMQELENLLQKSDAKRNIIAVEGIYSMDGDLCDKEVFTIAKRYDAILIVDEAHSSGVVGDDLMGVYDLYGVAIEPNHIKMGTLGKAYGSFGAYILASAHIVEYLLNRAKPLIYATSLSLYDTLLAHQALKYILANKEDLKDAIQTRHKIVKEVFGLDVDGLIVPIAIGDNKRVLQIKEQLLKEGYAIGAIRQPTVKRAILRIIARLHESSKSFEVLCQRVRELV